MAKQDKPIPKSLHTITAIVDVARYCAAQSPRTDLRAIKDAMDVLGLKGREDPYGLEATSLRFLKARKEKGLGA